MTFLSLCSGIEAASVAVKPLGWQPLAFAEIDPFCRSLLQHHYPHVQNLGDISLHKQWPALAPDLIIAGCPCQSFSVAGLRKGMADPRGNLTLILLAILNRLRPRWLVYENVPGLRSADDGRAFGAFLGGLAKLGYLFSWRSLDAQYFNLAQRRERLFLVAHSSDWRHPAAVLFEPSCLRGDPPPRRQTGQNPAPTLASRASAGGGLGTDFDCDGGLISAFGGNNTSGSIEVATAVNAKGGAGRMDFESETFIAHSLRAQSQSSHRADSETFIAHTLQAEGHDASEDGTGRGTPMTVVHGTQDPCADNHLAFGLAGNNGQENAVNHQSIVRRLTPLECERLMGFPDNYTLIPHRSKPASDSPRYKAIGNSFPVPVIHYISSRIHHLQIMQKRR